MVPISIDLDGVMSDFISAAKQYARLAGSSFPEHYEPPDWEWSDTMSEQSWDKTWDLIKDSENFWEQLRPYTDSVNALTRFQTRYPKSYQDTYFITSRSETSGESPQMQSSRWLAGLHLNGTVIRVHNPSEKILWMDRIGVHLSIDDKLETVLECRRHLPHHRPYLLNRSWNQSPEQHRFVRRVDSLQEFLSKVERADWSW